MTDPFIAAFDDDFFFVLDFFVLFIELFDELRSATPSPVIESEGNKLIFHSFEGV